MFDGCWWQHISDIIRDLSVIFNYFIDDKTMETNYKVLPVNDMIETASHKKVKLWTGISFELLEMIFWS